MQAARCPECNSQYFRRLDRFNDEGQKMPILDNEPAVLQCSNCNHTFTIQDGVPVTFTEQRGIKKPRPSAMQEGVTMKSVDEGGPVG